MSKFYQVKRKHGEGKHVYYQSFIQERGDINMHAYILKTHNRRIRQTLKRKCFMKEGGNRKEKRSWTSLNVPYLAFEMCNYLM